MENPGKEDKEHSLTMTFASQGFQPVGTFFGPGEELLGHHALTHKWVPQSLPIHSTNSPPSLTLLCFHTLPRIVSFNSLPT